MQSKSIEGSRIKIMTMFLPEDILTPLNKWNFILQQTAICYKKQKLIVQLRKEG